MVLKRFINNKFAVIHDTLLDTQIDVETSNRAPFCNYFKENDCAHVGFTVRAEQLSGNIPTSEDIISQLVFY